MISYLISLVCPNMLSILDGSFEINVTSAADSDGEDDDDDSEPRVAASTTLSSEMDVRIKLHKIRPYQITTRNSSM